MRIHEKNVRILSVILVAVMLFCASPLAGFNLFMLNSFETSSEGTRGNDSPQLKYAAPMTIRAAEAPHSEPPKLKCGENVTYTIDGAGTLTISGTGKMYDYDTGFFEKNISPFNDRSDIVKAVITEGVTSIGSYLFENCQDLTTVIMPDSVVSIGDGAFFCCYELKEANLSRGVTSIGEYAFGDCSGLTSLYVPAGLTYIDPMAFQSCGGLETIEADPGNPVYHAKDNCLIETGTKTLLRGCDNSTVPSDGSVNKIGAYAFSGCSGITKLILPDSILSIGDYAFLCCDGLTRAVLPDSITSIGVDAFDSCFSLENIVFPAGLTAIDEYTFFYCFALSTAVLPDSLTVIHREAFSGCPRLNNIFVPSGVKSIESYAFSWCEGLTDVYYAGSKEQWNTIDIDEDGNDNLLNAHIHFESSRPEPVSGELPGDVDGDGRVSAADARLALRASVGLENYDPGSREFTAADVDRDGRISAADARMILRASVGLEKLR